MKPHILNGMRVRDAKRTMRLVITADDVAKSDKKDPTHCAAACALLRQHLDEVRVHLSRIYTRKGKVWTRYITPRSMRQEIISFDRGGTFEPGVYILNKPQPTKSLGKGTGSGKRGKKKSKRLEAHITTNVRERAPL